MFEIYSTSPNRSDSSRRCLEKIRPTKMTANIKVTAILQTRHSIVLAFKLTVKHTQSINQSIKTLIHVDRPQRDKVHMVKIKIKSAMIHNKNNLNLNM